MKWSLNERNCRMVLASASPRRRELLSQLCPSWEIDIQATGITEDRYYELSPEERIARLSQEKAFAIDLGKVRHQSHCLVIAADTEVVLDGVALGKPADVQQCRSFLGSLAGRPHDVMTAFTVRSTTRENSVTRTVATIVRFKKFDPAIIDAYIATGEPFDKAGGYGIQERGVALVEEISGSYSNVVGLPLEELSAVLRDEFLVSLWGNR